MRRTSATELQFFTLQLQRDIVSFMGFGILKIQLEERAGITPGNSRVH